MSRFGSFRCLMDLSLRRLFMRQPVHEIGHVLCPLNRLDCPCMWGFVPSSPRPAPSWRYVTPEDTAASIEAWREHLRDPYRVPHPGSAVTAPPVQAATPVDSTPPLGHYFESGIGVGGSWSCNVDHGGSPCDWSTGAPAPTASSISTPVPSYVSRRSVAAPSRSE